MKRLVMIIVLLGICLPGSVRAETPGTMAAEAEQAYQSGDFTLASQKWEDLVAVGFINGNLLYNLGNAAWESGQGGRARWYYLRALKLNPRDDEIRSNLAFVDAKLGFKPPSGPDDGPWIYFKSLPWWKLSLNFYETLRLTAVLGAAFFGFLLWRHLRGKASPRWLRWTLGIPLGILATLLFFQGGSLYFTREAVILTPNLPLLSAPSLEAGTGQSLPEGTLVWVQKRQGNFTLAKIAGGNSAWLDSEGVGGIRL